jgi:hypothetical protein
MPIVIVGNTPRLMVSAQQLKKSNGLEVRVSGFKGDPTVYHPHQVLIEIWRGKLQVHVWNGNSEDPRTVVIEKEGGGN